MNLEEAYFNFIIEQLTNWFQDGHFQAGSRYYLHLEDQVAIDRFSEEIQQTKVAPVKPFVINNGHTVYQTMALEHPNLKAIIAPLGQQSHTNFLLNLQHQVSQQKGIFKGTMLIYVVDDTLPNIVFNARNLADSGGPFSLGNILGGLSDASALSTLKPGEQQVVSTILKTVLQRKPVHITHALAAIYQLYKKPTLEAQDYINYSLFYDPILKQTDPSITDKRLRHNRQLFKELKHLVSADDPGQRINNYLYFEDPKHYQKYSDLSYWSDLTYDEVLNARRSFLEKTETKAKLQPDKLDTLNQHFTFWLQQKHYADKPTQTHSAKEYSILAFLKPNQIDDQVVFRLPFDTVLEPGCLDYDQSFFYEGKTDRSDLIKVINRTIILKIDPLDPNQIYYGKIYYGADENHLPSIFKFAILPFDPKYFLTIAPFFSLDVTAGHYQIVLHTDNPKVTFLGANNQSVVKIPISEQNLQEFFISQTTELDFSGLLAKQSKINFTILTLNIYDHLVPLRFQFRYQRVFKRNLSNFAIENLRRQAPNGIFFDQDKLIERDKVYYLSVTQRQLLNIETQMIKHQHFYGVLNPDGTFTDQPLKLPEDVQVSLDQICQFLLDNEMTLSLSTWTKYLKDNVSQLLAQIRQHITDHLHDIVFPETIRNLFYIGAVKATDAFYLAPFSPLLMLYRLSYDKALDNVTLNKQIQDQISPAGLLPYLMMNGTLYQADTTYYNHWIHYTAKQTNHLKANYANIVSNILMNFKKHNAFLFQINPKQPLVIRFAHIYPDRTILKAVINYFKTNMLAQIPPEETPPLELFFQGYAKERIFEQFFQIQTPTALADLLMEPLDLTQLTQKQWSTLIQSVQENITLYYPDDGPVQDETPTYHISFYQPQTKIQLLNQLNQYVKPSFALSGLMPNKQTTMIDSAEIQGFGTKDLKRPLSDLVDFAGLWNTLALICHHQFSPYIQNNTWAIREEVSQDKETDQIIASSYQTILFMPKDELIQKLQNNPTLEFNRYHAVEPLFFDVTSVTKNTDKVQIWQTYLATHQVETTVDQIKALLKYDSLFTDFWRVDIPTEMLDLMLKQISAYKEISGILHQEDIIWVPISIKVLKHYADDFGLGTDNNLFSTKNLIESGLSPNDILLMGLDLRDQQTPLMYFYPILLSQQKFSEHNLATAIEDWGPDFLKDYTKAFFARVFLTNLKQLPEDDISKELRQKLETVQDALFRADFTISTKLRHFYGYTFRFNTDAKTTFRMIQKDKATANTTIDVPLSDIYTYALESKHHIQKLIQNSEFDFKLKNLLNQHLANLPKPKSHIKTPAKTKVTPPTATPAKIPTQVTAANVVNETTRHLPVKNLSSATTQFYLGKAVDSEMVLNWAYSNPELSDKNLLLFGNDNAIKKQFIQQLLLQLSKAKLSMVILVTDAKNMAYFSEKNFPDTTILPMNLEKIPIHLDPFFVIRQSIKNHYSDTTILTLINQIIEICRPSFNLSGNQVEQINQAIYTGLTKQTSTFKFSNLPTYLSDKNSLAKLKDLIDSDPFTYEQTLDWRHFFNGTGELNVIDCSSFSMPVRKFILDFLLNGLANEARTTGSTFHPMPIFIDNASSVNFSNKGQLAKALKQGSQYGISLVLNNPDYEPKADSLLMTNDFETQLFFKMSEEHSLLFAKILSGSLKEYSNLTKVLTNLTDQSYLISGHTLINQQLLPNLTTAHLDLK